MKIKKTLFYALLAGVLAACQPNDNSTSGDNGKAQGGVIQNFGMIMGTVRDTQGNFLGDVTISTEGLTAKTNAQGYFVLSNLPESQRMVIHFEKSGYVSTADITRIRIGESSYLEPVLQREAIHQSYPANTEGHISIANNGAAVTIPPGALLTRSGQSYNGSVDLSITPFDPTTTEGLAAFPGEFKGISLSGEIVPIESYGFMDITPRDSNGNLLQLKPGEWAEIAIPIAPSLIQSAPSTMPLWSFNKNDGQWHEEGTLVRDGAVYRAKISHFSIWNCDVAYVRSYVIGRVINCSENGEPVKGARVTIRGQRGWTSGETSTPEDGSFRIPVDANHNCTIWASKNGNESEKKSFTSAPSEGVYDVGDICLGTPKIKIALTWDLEPNDLDAHLTCPASSGREHVYFGNQRGTTAALDTDDTSSFGPEIISVFKLVDGKYRYSVHHFAGQKTISASKASVTLMVDGVGIYQMAAPRGAKGVGDLWILWDFTVEHGKVIKVEPVQSLKTTIGATSDHDFHP